MDTLSISFFNPDGVDGLDRDPNNPISRALDSLLRTGKPIDKLTQCHFEDTITATCGSAPILRWVGVFVLSVAGRLIFFPGYARSFQQIQTICAGQHLSYGFHPDHMTLEKTLGSTHMTSANSRRHSGSLPTASLGHGRYLWFGMSVNPRDLREFKKETYAVAESPPADSRRRCESFMKAREGQVFQGLCLNPAASREPAGFLHLSAIAGPPGFDDYIGPRLGFPYESPFLARPLKPIPDLPVRSHRLSFESRMELQIVCTWLPGRLRDDVGIAFSG